MMTAKRWLPLALLLLAMPVLAHSPASSRLTIHDGGRLTADLPIVDLRQFVAFDSNRDRRLTWGELQAAVPAVDALLGPALELRQEDAACRLIVDGGRTALVTIDNVQHLSISYRSSCNLQAAGTTIAFSLFRAIDPSHRVYLRSADGTAIGVLSARQPTAEIGAGSRPVGSMFIEGVQHILEGYDHLLFLLLLVLPALGADGLKRRLLRLAGIVTAFTAAHSVTLALAATGVLYLPGKPVEIAIALSIVAAGVVNVVSPEHRIGWKLAAGFGLLHGFGFAGALAEIGLGGGSLLTSLLAFNLGVEAGQLLVVCAALPVLFLATRWSRYRGLLVPLLSGAGASAGLFWAVSRL